MRMKMIAATILIFLALCSAAVVALPEPAADPSLVVCEQYRFPDGDCWEICTFRSPTGEPQGYIISRSC